MQAKKGSIIETKFLSRFHEYFLYLLIAGEVVAVTAEAAVETAAAVTETMTTVATAGVAAEVAAAAGMAEAVEAVALLLLITEADHEGTTAHVPDLTHHVSFWC